MQARTTGNLHPVRPSLNDNLHATAPIVRRPIYTTLVPFPLACFVGTLLTDIAYWRTAQMMWADFSAWLLAIGMVTGVLAVIAGVIDFLANRSIRSQHTSWLHTVGIIVVLALALLNTLVHTRDAWTSVVPNGLILSAIVVLFLPITGWLGWPVIYRRDAGAIR
jgi:uncharacterized membrane protein